MGAGRVRPLSRRCQKCLRATGASIRATYALTNGRAVTRTLCEHCALHDDTPAINCVQCYPTAASL